MAYYGKAPAFGTQLDADLDLNGFTINGEGILTGGVQVLDKSGATEALAVADCMGQLIQATKSDGGQEFDLPAVATSGSDGMFVTIIATEAQILTVDPHVDDRIVGIDGVALSDGVSISSAGGVGDSITLYKDSGTGWRVISVNGAWA